MEKKENAFKKFIKELFQQSFTKKGKPYMPYIYLWVMLVVILMVVLLKVFKWPERITDIFALGLCGFVATWIGLFKITDLKKGE